MSMYSIFESTALRTFKKVAGGYELKSDVEAVLAEPNYEASDIGGFDSALGESEAGTVVLKKGTKVVARTNGEFIVRNDRGAWVFVETAL